MFGHTKLFSLYAVLLALTAALVAAYCTLAAACTAALFSVNKESVGNFLQVQTDHYCLAQVPLRILKLKEVVMKWFMSDKLREIFCLCNMKCF